MTKTIFTFLTVLFAVSAFCAPAKVRFTKDGFIDIDQIGFTLVWMDKNWKQSPASSAKNDTTWKLIKCTDDQMIYKVNGTDGAPGEIVMKLAPGRDENQFILTADARFSGECSPNFLGLKALRLSVADFGGLKYAINGKVETFPAKYKKYVLWSGKCDQFKLPSASGSISLDGPFYMHIQDSRRWNTAVIAARIGFEPFNGKFTSSQSRIVITVNDKDFSLGRPDIKEYFLKADKDWAAIDNKQDVIPGSALDFSGRISSPAGNKGFLKIKGDKFYFEKEPDKPVKFYGTNLVGTSQVIEKEQSEILAKRFAAFGFNSIRIHHHDNEVCDRKDTRKLDPVLMDKFDYLIYCLKKNGLHITTDVYVSRRGITKEELPKYGPISGLAEYKGFFWIDDDVFQNWKDAAKNFYTHVNPYTGLALIDDPALISLSLVNEGNPFSWCNASARVSRLYSKKLAEYRKTNPKATLNEFCSYLAAKRYREMKEYMISLGCKVPLTDQNFIYSKHLAWERAQYDYVDNHGYWDHPRFVVKNWNLPVAPSNVNVLKRISNIPSKIFPTRVLGMPFFVTEFDFAAPNIHRLHGPALFAAYAAFQEWDGVYQFAYAHSGKVMFDLNAAGHYFDLSRDPAKALAHKLAARIFLYGEIKPAPATVALTPADNKNDRDPWPDNALALGFVAKLGSDVGKPGVKYDIKLDQQFFKNKPFHNFNAKKILPEGYLSNSGKLFWTPQLRFEPGKGTFRLTSDGAEVISLQAKQSLKGKRLEVENGGAEATVAIIPQDTTSFKSVKRLILIHLTDCQTTDRHFSNRSMSQLNDWGKTPFLVRRNSAKVTLNLEGKEWKVYSLGLDGARKKEIPYTTTGDGRLQLTVNTADQLACELVRK